MKVLALLSVALGLALPPAIQQEGKLEELRKLRRERRLKEAQKGDVEALGKSIKALIPDFTQSLLKDLKSGGRSNLLSSPCR